ncbi:hypothetical protein TWF694_003849 [Orbilia ellipsospora]|uniref:Uncharacterized protein n=1 Tax=Orbilia ellipsospora TaxID=2528407 RepID=A0AAV9X093_9PEZI
MAASTMHPIIGLPKKAAWLLTTLALIGCISQVTAANLEENRITRGIKMGIYPGRIETGVVEPRQTSNSTSTSTTSSSSSSSSSSGSSSTSSSSSGSSSSSSSAVVSSSSAASSSGAASSGTASSGVPSSITSMTSTAVTTGPPGTPITEATGISIVVNVPAPTVTKRSWAFWRPPQVLVKRDTKYLQAISRTAGGYDYILSSDQNGAAVWDIKNGQLIDSNKGGIVYASDTDVSDGLGPWQAFDTGGDITIQFAVDSGSGGLTWKNPAFVNMGSFEAVVCVGVDDAGVSSVSWKYDAAQTRCSGLVIQATGGNLPAPTTTPTLAPTTTTPGQSFSGSFQSQPTNSPTSSSSTGSDTNTVLPTNTESGVTTSTITDTATITSTSLSTSLVTVTSCGNNGCSRWTSTTTQTSTTLYTQPCTTLPIPVPVSEAPRAESGWFLLKCAVTVSVASLIGFVAMLL